MADVNRENLANYATAWSVSEYTRSRALTPWEARQVAAHFPAAPARILDLGCGAGRTTIALAAMGHQVVGIDLADRLLEEARRLAPGIEVRHMDAAQLTFDDGSFDAALFSYNGLDCLYPLATRERCLREVHRVLKPGGVFLLSSHNVLGASFSGGFLYVRGWINALGFVRRQLREPLAREWYLAYEDGGGVQHLYSAPPERTVGQLIAAGFARVELSGRDGTTDRTRVRWHEAHPQFVAWRAP